MKKNVKDYLWNNLLMEFALIMLWVSILYVILNNDFIIWMDVKVFAGITALGTIVWGIGFIHEVKK